MKKDKPQPGSRKKALPKNRYRVQKALRPEFYQAVREVLERSRANAYRAVNFAMVEAYWNVGRRIVEEEQQGKERADYGTQLIRNLSACLTFDFGEGVTERNFRQFYLCFPIRSTMWSELETPSSSDAHPIWHTVCAKSPDDLPSSTRGALRPELSWSHYRLLIRVEKPEARSWYLNEAADQGWSVRALERQINSLYYERLRLSRDKAPVEAEAQDMTVPLGSSAADFIKDPYVLEFLGLPDAHAFREAELEQAIIGKLQSFTQYSVLQESRQLFAARYKLYLPAEQELIEAIEREKALILREREARYA